MGASMLLCDVLGFIVRVRSSAEIVRRVALPCRGHKSHHCTHNAESVLVGGLRSCLILGLAIAHSWRGPLGLWIASLVTELMTPHCRLEIELK
jgi:hypothetical protein